MIGPQPAPAKAINSSQTSQRSEDELSGSYDGFESESDDFMVKDETELELEKLVFGDNAGFHANLNSDRPDAFSQPPSEKLAETRYDEVGSGLEGGLEGLDDAEVCTLCSLRKISIADVVSCFSSTPYHPQYQIQS